MYPAILKIYVDAQTRTGIFVFDFAADVDTIINFHIQIEVCVLQVKADIFKCLPTHSGVEPKYPTVKFTGTIEVYINLQPVQRQIKYPLVRESIVKRGCDNQTRKRSDIERMGTYITRRQ